MNSELSFADNLALEILDWVKEFEDKKFLNPDFPIQDFSYMCTKISKEDLDKAHEIMREADSRLSQISSRVHKIAYEFEAASAYTTWLKNKNLAFGYEKSLVSAPLEEDKTNSKDITQSLTDEQALKMVEMLKGRFNL